MSFDYKENPTDLSCFNACMSCYRCGDKGKYDRCNSCSGRHDPEAREYPGDFADRCQCTQGVLQYRLKNGRLIVRRYLSDPFAAQVITDSESEDERDWNSYIAEKREKLGDPNYDGVYFNDGTGATDWMQNGGGV